MGLNGKTGIVKVAIRGRTGPGQVQLTDGSTVIAWSTEEISRGSEVVVTAERSTRTVTVSPTGL